MPHCQYCAQSFVSGRGEGYRYTDHRVICYTCHSQAVKTTASLAQVRDHTLGTLAHPDLGISLSISRVPVTLASRDELMETTGLLQNIDGLARVWVKHSWFGHRLSKAEILLLYGIPYARCVATLAHEITHLFIAERDFQFSVEKEEGLCNLIALMTLKRIATRSCIAEAHRMWGNPDPVYGKGMRLEYMKYTTKYFPRQSMSSYIALS